MKLWKRGLAMLLAAGMLLVLLTACGGSSGPSTPEQPGGSGSSGTGGTEQPGKDPGTGESGGGTGESGGSGSGETGSGSGTEEPGKDDKEDENDPKTEEQKKIAETVAALNKVRKDYDNEKPLVLNADACALATQMAQVQLDGVNGVYGSDPMKSENYQAAWNEVSKKTVNKKSVIGIGGYGAYPTEAVFRDWAGSASKWKVPLVRSSEATLVGVGVVKNTNEKTKKDWPYMVVVMTY